MHLNQRGLDLQQLAAFQCSNNPSRCIRGMRDQISGIQPAMGEQLEDREGNVKRTVTASWNAGGALGWRRSTSSCSLNVAFITPTKSKLDGVVSRQIVDCRKKWRFQVIGNDAMYASNSARSLRPRRQQPDRCADPKGNIATRGCVSAHARTRQRGTCHLQ